MEQATAMQKAICWPLCCGQTVFLLGFAISAFHLVMLVRLNVCMG